MIANKKIEWIFFDLDGTLADSVPALRQAYFDFLAEFGVRGTKEEFEECNGPSLPEIVAMLKTRYELVPSEERLMDIYNEKMAKAYEKVVKPMDGAEDLIHILATEGYCLGLVTSARKELVTGFLDQYFPEGHLQSLTFGSEVVKAKPDPDIYLRALIKTNASPERTLIVEDSLRGVIAAREAGVCTVALVKNNTGKELLQAGANATILRLQELLPIVHGAHE